MANVAFKNWLDLIESVIEGPRGYQPYPLRAVFTAGGPGSGKTTIATQMFAEFGFKFANIDDIAQMLARKCGDEDVIRSTEGQPGHDRKLAYSYTAMNLISKRAKCWTDCCLSYVIDTTGRNASFIEQMNRALKNEGYDTSMVFISTSVDTSIRRVAGRVDSGGHAVDEPYQRQAWADAQQNLHQYRNIFGLDMLVVDNDKDVDPRERASMGRQFYRKAVQLLGQQHTVENPIGQQKLEDTQGWYARQRGSDFSIPGSEE
jgi:predicted ABC-type ATPase